MRRLVLALAFISVAALSACGTAAEPAVIESPSATAGQLASDVDYLTCRPNCSNENFYRLDLSNADLSGIDFAGSVFDNTNLTGARLGGARLEGAIWDNTTCVDGVVRSGSCTP